MDIVKKSIPESVKEFAAKLTAMPDVAYVYLFGFSPHVESRVNSDIDIAIIVKESPDFDKKYSFFTLAWIPTLVDKTNDYWLSRQCKPRYLVKCLP